MTILLRPATPEDRAAIADLHIGLSRSAYAHIFSAAYLENTVATEKQALWRDRLSTTPDPGHLTINVAEVDGVVRGFSCFVFDEHDPHGAYLHNLYVHSSAQRRGIAQALIAAGLERFPARFDHRGVHLKALEENHPAVALYRRLGGTVLERVSIHPAQSHPAAALRFGWASPQVLRQAVRA
ncbi:MAG: GNAT family N-acetyltransferase [Devosia sp.]|nr:GNAT family N-acetyltransferase [Devosia sp.]